MEVKAVEKKQKVVVVLPTYNEKEHIATIISQVLEQHARLPNYDLQVLVADSHSPDGTGEIVLSLAKQDSRISLLDVRERGLGTGYWRGFQQAKNKLNADIILGMDADGQHDPVDIPRFIDKLNEGYDFVTGSRYISQGGIKEWSLPRRILSLAANWLVMLLTGVWHIHEFTTSYRAFRAQLLDKLAQSRLSGETSWVFAPIFITEVITGGAKVAEIPIVFSKRAAGESKMATWEYIYDLMAYALEFRLHKWGANLPVLHLARRLKTFTKFGIVGLSGTIVDFFFYVALVEMGGLMPATAKAFSAEIAIVNNFAWNNTWTFGKRNVSYPLWRKFLTFNFVSFGGLMIGVLIVKLMTWQFGNQHYRIFFFFTIPPVLVWNFFVNHYVTWKKGS